MGKLRQWWDRFLNDFLERSFQRTANRLSKKNKQEQYKHE